MGPKPGPGPPPPPDLKRKPVLDVTIFSVLQEASGARGRNRPGRPRPPGAEEYPRGRPLAPALPSEPAFCEYFLIPIFLFFRVPPPSSPSAQGRLEGGADKEPPICHHTSIFCIAGGGAGWDRSPSHTSLGGGSNHDPPPLGPGGNPPPTRGLKKKLHHHRFV